MSPRERLAVALESILAYGSSHLRCEALNMPWYKLLMIDILAVVLASFLISVIKNKEKYNI